MTANTTNTTNTMIVRSDDADLHVRTAGDNPDGETLVVLHGGPGLSHDYMSSLVELASPDLRIALYDQRSVGRSTGQVDHDLLDSQVRDLAAVQEALGARRVHLLGHSFGGLVLALFAREHPDTIASAIFVDSAPLTRPELDAALANLMQRLEKLTSANLITPGDPSTDMTAWVRAALPAYFHDPQHQRAREHGGVTASPEVYAATLEALADYDLTSAIRSLSVPSLVLAFPIPFGTEMGRSVASALPADQTDLATLDACGHLPWLEQPERFQSLVQEFLTKRAGLPGPPADQ